MESHTAAFFPWWSHFFEKPGHETFFKTILRPCFDWEGKEFVFWLYSTTRRITGQISNKNIELNYCLTEAFVYPKLLSWANTYSSKKGCERCICMEISTKHKVNVAPCLCRSNHFQNCGKNNWNLSRLARESCPKVWHVLTPWSNFEDISWQDVVSKTLEIENCLCCRYKWEMETKRW